MSRHAVKKVRQSPGLCGCGCGAQLSQAAGAGRPRKYVDGHARMAPKYDHSCKCGCGLPRGESASGRKLPYHPGHQITPK